VSGISFIVSDEHQDDGGQDASAHQRKVVPAESRADGAAERAGRVVEARRDLGETRFRRLQAHRQKPHDVGEEQAADRAGQHEARRAAEGERGDFAEDAIEPREREQDADRDHRPGQGVGHRRRPRRSANRRRGMKPRGVGEDERQDRRADRGERRQRERVAEEGRERSDRPARGSVAHPDEQLDDRQDERDRENAESRGAGGPRPPTREPLRRHSVAVSGKR
jgi:hypothetical protein